MTVAGVQAWASSAERGGHPHRRAAFFRKAINGSRLNYSIKSNSWFPSQPAAAPASGQAGAASFWGGVDE